MSCEAIYTETDLETAVEDAVQERDGEWARCGYRMGSCRTPRATPIPRELAEPLGLAIVESYLGVGVIREAVDRALLASARTGTKPTRSSILAIAGAYVARLINREINRRMRELDRDSERRAA